MGFFKRKGKESEGSVGVVERVEDPFSAPRKVKIARLDGTKQEFVLKELRLTNDLHVFITDLYEAKSQKDSSTSWGTVWLELLDDDVMREELSRVFSSGTVKLSGPKKVLRCKVDVEVFTQIEDIAAAVGAPKWTVAMQQAVVLAHAADKGVVPS